jgi:hypothetical protein
MRTCSFRLQIASAAMAVAQMVCSVARADEPTDFYQGKSITLYLSYARALRAPEFRAEADRLALEIDLVTGETPQAMVKRMFGSRREVVEAARRAIGQLSGTACGNLFEAGAATGPPASVITASSS